MDGPLVTPGTKLSYPVGSTSPSGSRVRAGWETLRLDPDPVEPVDSVEWWVYLGEQSETTDAVLPLGLYTNDRTEVFGEWNRTV